MEKILIIAALVSLGGCQPSNEVPADATAPPPAQFGTSVQIAQDVWKSCDAGRAIYTFYGYSKGGLAVVENAAECAQ